MRIIRVLRWAAYCGVVAGLSLLSNSLRGAAVTAPVWPAGAVMLTFALRGTRSLRGRTAAVLLGCASAALVGLLLGRPLDEAVGRALCNAVEIAIGLAALWRFESPVLGARGFFRLVVGASLLGPMASTAAAAGLFALVHVGGDVVGFALRWFAAHALGMMVTAPVLLSLGPEIIPRERAIRIGAVQAAVLAVNLFAFTRGSPPSLVLIAPLMALAVFAGGEAGAAITLALTGLSALMLTALGFGPEAGSAGLYLYQGFLACISVGAHALAALMRQLEGYSLELDGPQREPAE